MRKHFFANIPLLISIFIAMTIASTEAPLWVISFSGLMIFWKFLNEKFAVPKLAPVLTPLLGIMIFLIVYLQNKTVFGQEESTTILLGLTALAILNYQFERDVLFLVLLGFLILVTKAIFSLDFIWVIPSLFSFFGFWFTLLGDSKTNRYQYVLKTTLISLPLLTFLFIFFPRFVVFQSSKMARNSAQSGFTEDLTPGNFSSLALQNELVFRAEFNSDIRPKIETLYWRGAILDISNGLNWQKGKIEKVSQSQKGQAKAKLSKSKAYSIIQEAFNLKNIFALENSLSVNSSTLPISQLDSGIFSLAEIPKSAFQFSAESTSENAELSAAESIDPEKYLRYPSLPEKTAAWVEKTKTKFPEPAARLKALENFFAKSGFFYTLSPGTYKNNLDDFLFSRKRGFCEHYAAAFATLARALEIQARVIIGYQGGAYNSVGHFWKISQKDAHAWVEVVQNNHWQRADPTAQVSPLRMALGGEAYFSLSEDEQILFSKNSNWTASNSSFALWNQTTNFFENLNYHWTLFLLDYNLQAQLQFLKTLSVIGVTIFFIFIVTVILIFLYGQQRKKITGTKINPLAIVLSQIESWALTHKLTFDQSITPLQLLNHVNDQFPQARVFITEFIEEYTRVTYQNQRPTRPCKLWKKQWTQLKSQILLE